MRKEDVERSIARLDEQLRDALLLSTKYTFAEGAKLLNIEREQLVQRVDEAKRTVITELLGDWQDSESMFLVDMHIDAVAMEMQRHRMGVLYRLRKWLQSVGQTGTGFVEAIGKLPQGRQVSVPTGAVATIALVVVAVYLYPAMNDNNDLPKEVRAQQEIVFWKSIDDSRNPVDYQAYLHRWPAGIYADLARERLARPAPMSRTEAAEFEREASFGSGSPPSEPSATVILARALTTLRLLSDSALWVCDDRPDGTSQVQVRWQETCRGEMEERRRRLERRHEALEDVVRALAAATRAEHSGKGRPTAARHGAPRVRRRLVPSDRRGRLTRVQPVLHRPRRDGERLAEPPARWPPRSRWPVAPAPPLDMTHGLCCNPTM